MLKMQVIELVPHPLLKVARPMRQQRGNCYSTRSG